MASPETDRAAAIQAGVDPEFLSEFLAAWDGGSVKLAAFLFETFALDPHTHTSDQIFVDADETQTLDEVLPDEDEETEDEET